MVYFMLKLVNEQAFDIPCRAISDSKVVCPCISEKCVLVDSALKIDIA